MSTFMVALGKKLVRDIEWPIVGPEDLDDPGERFPERADAEAAEHGLRQRAAALARDQHVRARGAFGIGQHAVLLDDERAAQRHHHQDAQDAAGEGQHQDLEIAEVAGAVRRQEDQRRDREDDAAGDRLAGGSDRLDDVVLEDGRAAQLLQHRDGEHGDRDRGADRQAGPQAQVDGRGPEDQAEQHAQDDGLGRELRRRLAGRHVGLKRRLSGPVSRRRVGHRGGYYSNLVPRPSAL